MASAPLPSNDQISRRLFRYSIGVFFFGGFLTSTVSLLVPRLTLTLHLSYAQALLVQLAFHSSYLLFAVPITLVIVRIDYMRAISAGLAVMVLGCVGFAAAQFLRDFLWVLGALLLLAAGITFLQIASNTIVTIVGPSAQAAARLTFLQGYNALGTVLGPLLCAPLLLGELGGGPAGSALVALPFLATSLALALLSALFLWRRDLLARRTGRSIAPALRQLPALFADRRLIGGTAAIFAYVGAEVTIGALLTNYLMLPRIIGAAPVMAGSLVSLYWGGAMIGRFAGAFLLRRLPAPHLLLGAAIGAALLTGAAILVDGAAGATLLLAVGLCNAIMYPTIYALAMPEEEETAPMASMLLCMAVVGGAIVPMLTGIAADRFGLIPALTLPALCYVGIAFFAGHCRTRIASTEPAAS